MPSNKQDHDTTIKAIEISNLELAFLNRIKNRSSTEVFTNLNFDVEQLEFVTIVGRSGCGKSSLLKVIGGVIPQDRILIRLSGNVSVLGTSPESIISRNEFGMIFQKPQLLPWLTVKENVKFTERIITEGNVNRFWDAHDLMESLGIAHLKNKLPGTLSGGEQHRLAIARTLYYKPKILLMDEPFASLDAITKESICVDLLKIRRLTNSTILFVTHNLRDAIFLGDRVIVLKPSRDGSHGGPQSSISHVTKVPFGDDRSPEMKQTSEFNQLEGLLRSEL